MKKLIVLFVIVLSYYCGSAQWAPPPVTFSWGADVCDDEPWKLVFMMDLMEAPLTKHYFFCSLWQSAYL